MGEVIKGIDISSHQGEIDFERVKADGVRFVIIKAGQGLREMGTFRQKYLPEVLAAGLDWGAYWWSDAVTAAEAQKEAAAFVKALDGLRPTYPVYMDQEYESPCGNAWGVGKGKQLRTDMAKAFLKVLEDAGCYAGLCRACGRHFRIDGYQRLLPGLPGDHSDKSAQRLEKCGQARCANQSVR